MTKVRKPRINKKAAEMPSTRRRPHRWRWRAIVLLAGCGLVTTAGLLPTLVTKSGWADRMIAATIPSEAGFASVASVRAGWWRPLEIRGLRIFDASGHPLIEVSRVTIRRTLLQLLANRHDLGEVVLSEPKLELSLREQGSNLEDMLSKAWPLASDGPSTQPAAPPSAEVKIINAQIAVRCADAPHRWFADKVDAEISFSTASPWRVSLRGQLEGQPFVVQVSMPRDDVNDSWLPAHGDLQIDAQGVPLGMLRPIAHRLGQPLQHLHGSLSTNLKLSWEHVLESSRRVVSLSGNVELAQLQLCDRRWCDGEPLKIEQLRLETEAMVRGPSLQLKRCALQSDIGDADLQLMMSLPRTASAGALWTALQQTEMSTSGRVDVAALAEMLPRPFHFQQDVRLVRGSLSWTVRSQRNQQHTRWQARVATSDFAALQGDEPLAWQLPLELSGSALCGEEFVLERLELDSDALAVSAQGRLQQGEVTIRGDLDQLANELGRVIDLGSQQLRGQIQGTMQWNVSPQGSLLFAGDGRLQDFVWQTPGVAAWKEQDLRLTASLTSSLRGGVVESVDAGHLRLQSDKDLGVVQLRAPVNLGGVVDPIWSVACHLQGDVSRWLARTPLLGHGGNPQPPVTGWLDMRADVDWSPPETVISSLEAEVRSLSLTLGDREIQEAVLQLKAAGSIDHSTLACQIHHASGASPTVSFATKDFTLHWASPRLVSGSVGYRADVARCLHTLLDTRPQWSGQSVGQLQVHSQSGRADFELHGRVENLRRVQTGHPWPEPQLSFTSAGSYDFAKDRLELVRGQLQGSELRVETAGTVEEVTSAPQLTLSGEYECDVSTWLQLSGVSAVEGLQFHGASPQKFSLSGPLLPSHSRYRVAPQLTAQAGIAWESGKAFGVPLGATRMTLQLREGVLSPGSVSLSIGAGRVQLAPDLDVNSERLWMKIAPGRLAEQLHITPEIAQRWMKYVAPLLADATAAEGRFSVDVDRAEIPLQQPTASQLEGRLVIHGGQVGPGPLAVECIELATQLKQLLGRTARVADPSRVWVTLPPQEIEVQMVDGRVFHQGFTMLIEDVPLRTRGSVRLADESLALIAEVSIQNDWIQGIPALSGWRGQMVSIPISGTLSRPRLDRQALASVSRQLMQGAARGYLLQEVDNRLRKEVGGPLEGILRRDSGDLGDALENELERQLKRWLK